MFDEDNEPRIKNKDATQPRNLEALSVEELEAYLTFLESEMARAHSEIESKKGHHAAAASVFKS